MTQKGPGVEELFLLPDERKSFWEKAYLATVEGLLARAPGVVTPAGVGAIGDLARGAADRALSHRDDAWPDDAYVARPPEPPGEGSPAEEEEPRYLGQ